LRILKLLDVVLGEHRTVDFERQFVKLGCGSVTGSR
jgi:hypothetical protein